MHITCSLQRGHRRVTCLTWATPTLPCPILATPTCPPQCHRPQGRRCRPSQCPPHPGPCPAHSRCPGGCRCSHCGGKGMEFQGIPSEFWGILLRMAPGILGNPLGNSPWNSSESSQELPPEFQGTLLGMPSGIPGNLLRNSPWNCGEPPWECPPEFWKKPSRIPLRIPGNHLRNAPRIPGNPPGSPDGAASEEDNSLQPLVVEEVIEGPEAAVLPKRIRVQVRIVAAKNGNSEGLGIPGGSWEFRGLGNDGKCRSLPMTATSGPAPAVPHTPNQHF